MRADPGVALFSHVPRHRHAAQALAGAGLLDRYLTTPLRSRPLRLPDIGPVAAFNASRVYAELDGVDVSNLWVAAGVAGTASRLLGRRDRGRAFRAAARAWDTEASFRLGRPDVLHFPSGVGLISARRASRRGAILVCDQRLAHVDVHHRSVSAAYRDLGMEGVFPVLALRPRIVAEHGMADLIVCNSDYCRRTFLEQGVDPSKVVTVRLGCDPSGFSPASRQPDRFTVLFAGRFTPDKGAATFASGGRALGSESAVLVAGAPGDLGRRLLGGVDASVELAGHVPASDMPAMFRRSSVLVLPSFSDGWGMVVLEAMASGLPVIVSDRTGAADVVEDGVNGWVIPAGDAEALADRLTTLECDRDRVARMGAAARRTALDNTWATYRERLLEVYRERLAVAV